MVPCLSPIRKDVDQALVRAVDRIARKWEPSLRTAFLRAVAGARRTTNLQAIADAITAVDPTSAYRAVAETMDYDKMKEILDKIVIESGSRATTSISRQVGPIGGRVIGRFDIANPYAKQYARLEVGALIRDISAKTQDGIQNLIVQAVTEGGHPYTTAKKIRGMIGLTEYQTNVVLNYENKLLAAGITDVDAKVQRYAEKWLRLRANTIARTETLDAANGGQQAAWRAAMDQGFIDQEVEQEWIITGDERLCPICEPIPSMEENQHVKVGEYFMRGENKGPVKRPPAHPQCRCSLALRFPTINPETQ